MREEFEAWYADRECYNKVQATCWLVKESCGGYTYRDPNEAWKIWQAGWQASRAAIEVELPSKRDCNFDEREISVVETCRQAIEAAGLKVKS